MAIEVRIYQAATAEGLQDKVNQEIGLRSGVTAVNYSIDPLQGIHTCLVTFQNGDNRYASGQSLSPKERAEADYNTFLWLVKEHGGERAGELFGYDPREFARERHLPKDDPFVKALGRRRRIQKA